MPNCRTVSSCRYRVPVSVFSATTSDLSTSLASRSSSAGRIRGGSAQTASTAVRVNPPENTDSLRSSTCSGSVSRSWLHSNVPRSVRCRVALFGPPPRVDRASPNRWTISAGSSTAVRAAANSRASGMPSSRRHRSITPCALSASSVKPGLTCAARSTNSRTAASWPSWARSGSSSRVGDGSANDGTRKVYSPWACSGSRLVASTCTVGQPASRSVARWEQAASRCSQLSRTISSVRLRSWSTRVWLRFGAAPESNLSASATASATSSDSPTAARSTNQTPSGYL